jgi:hypothetical protein
VRQRSHKWKRWRPEGGLRQLAWQYYACQGCVPGTRQRVASASQLMEMVAAGKGECVLVQAAGRALWMGSWAGGVGSVGCFPYQLAGAAVALRQARLCRQPPRVLPKHHRPPAARCRRKPDAERRPSSCRAVLSPKEAVGGGEAEAAKETIKGDSVLRHVLARARIHLHLHPSGPRRHHPAHRVPARRAWHRHLPAGDKEMDEECGGGGESVIMWIQQRGGKSVVALGGNGGDNMLSTMTTRGRGEEWGKGWGICQRSGTVANGR